MRQLLSLAVVLPYGLWCAHLLAGICFLLLVSPPLKAPALFTLHQAVARGLGRALASSNFHKQGSIAAAPASSTAPSPTPGATSQEPKKALHDMGAEQADMPHYPKTEIVIAHYNDNLSWVETYTRMMPRNALWTIYCKGDPATPLDGVRSVVHHLPNVGREAHSHLWHIVQHYHNLADHTMFLPGSPDGQMEHLLSLGQVIPDFQLWKRDNFMELLENWRDHDFWCPTHAIPPDSMMFRQKGWQGSNYENNNTIYQVQPTVTGSAGHLVYRNSRGFYEHLLSLMSDHPNPEDGFFMERAWATVFEQDKLIQPLVYRSYAAMHPELEGLKFRSDAPISQQT
eukprot:jgi/Astpho2/8461/Aster-07646